MYGIYFYMIIKKDRNILNDLMKSLFEVKIINENLLKLAIIY